MSLLARFLATRRFMIPDMSGSNKFSSPTSYTPNLFLFNPNTLKRSSPPPTTYFDVLSHRLLKCTPAYSRWNLGTVAGSRQLKSGVWSATGSSSKRVYKENAKKRVNRKRKVRRLRDSLPFSCLLRLGSMHMSTSEGFCHMHPLSLKWARLLEGRFTRMLHAQTVRCHSSSMRDYHYGHGNNVIVNTKLLRSL